MVKAYPILMQDTSVPVRDHEKTSSPEPVALELNVPSEADSHNERGNRIHLGLDVKENNFLSSWKDPSHASDDESHVRSFLFPSWRPLGLPGPAL